MKVKSIAYWVTTGLVAFAMLSGGIMELIRNPANMEGMRRLGYPDYFASILGVWKVLGTIAILLPGLPRMKEWAYAGIFFDLTGAVISHYVCHEYAHMAAPLIIAGIMIVSWALRPPGRKSKG